MAEMEVGTEPTPGKRSRNIADPAEGNQTRKRLRSPDGLPPTPQSEPARPFATALETTLESETTPSLSGPPIQELELTPVSRQMADAAAQTEPFETPTLPMQVQNAILIPPYYPEIPTAQEPYLGDQQHVDVSGNNNGTRAVDMTAGPLSDPDMATYTSQWPPFPIAPTILPAEGTSTEMGYMGPGALEGPFQYQQSAERLYRPSEAQFDFARNLQEAIAVESPQNEPLNLLAGVANSMNEQRVDFLIGPVSQENIEMPPEEPLDLNEIVPNLFFGSYVPRQSF